MNTGMKALNKRITNFSAARDKTYKATPTPELRYVPFPLNDMQQAYWIGRSSDLAGGGTAIQYYISFAMDKFDEERFNYALNTLIQRHDMLRVVIRPNGMQQVLEQPPAMRVVVEDLTQLDNAAREQRLQTIVDEMWRTVSDLSRWPQSEFRYTITGPQLSGILHCKLDMWCFDGRSSQIFFEELAALYQNPQTELRPLQLRFCDYMRAVQKEEKSEEFARDLAYWKNRVKTLPPPPNLPTNAAGQSATPGEAKFTTREHRVSREDTSRIIKTCANQGVSLTSFMASAYSEVLRLWSGQHHMTLNFPRFNRQLSWHPDVNDMIGEFASFTLLECRNEPETSFLERTVALQTQMWEDLEYSRVPGLRILRERVIEMGQPEVQAMPIVFTAMPDRRSSRDALEKAFAVFGDILSCRGATPQVWLDCQYFVLNDELCVSWDSQDHVFPEGMISDMFAKYIRIVTLLGDKAHWGKQVVAQAPRHQIELRRTQNNIPMELEGGTALHLFREAARTQGSRPAIINGTTTLSYVDLYSMAMHAGEAISQRTKENGAVRVAVVLERGWEQIAAVMGTLAAGLAYVPIDPEMPRERMESILAAASPGLLIGSESLRQLESIADTPVVLLQELIEESRSRNAHVPELSGPSPDAPAYTIFTSGSTGIPKGVTIGHTALLNLVLYTNALFSLKTTDTVFGITALHHDLSVYDIFGTLAAGATLVLPTVAEASLPAQWANLVRQRQVTLWNSVPMFMEQLLAHAGDELLPLRTVVLGGDWVNPGILHRLKLAAPAVTLYTIGGPTETTVWNIINKVEELLPGWESLPYGRPIYNASYHIFDERLMDVPDWTQGEMFCGGVPLCLSASLDPQENSRAFATHPETGERVYRTGDVGRFRPDGMIEILGRKDFQLNINGYRLDPSEIEQVLTRHDGVRRALVAASSASDAADAVVLTAFIVPAEQVDVQRLQRNLRQWANTLLPASMRPRRWLFLQDFPLTANGKIDRKALGELAHKEKPEQDALRQTPQNPVEKFMMELWQEILPQSTPCMRSSFFELGGDSLKALQIFSRVEKKLGIRLSLAQMFITPTIEELAEEIYHSISAKVAAKNNSQTLQPSSQKVEHGWQA